MKIIDVLTSPWAIQPEKYNEIIRIYQAHALHERIDIKAVEAQLGYPLDNEQMRYEVIDGVAVIPVSGVLGKKMNLLTQISGGSSTQIIMQDLASALEDPVVKSILLLVDSPGGAVDGTQDLANMIYEARGTKPLVALADGVTASAAYWIASAADSVYASNETAQIGSIGVVTSHVDMSKSEERAGLKTTEIYAGRYKRVVSNYKPLDAEGEEYLQGFVDYIYSVFVEDVARNRGTDVETVLRDMADGRLFVGQQAVDAGLVDGIMSYGELLREMESGEPVNGRNGLDGQGASMRKKPIGANTNNNQQGGAEMGTENKAAETATTPQLTAEDIQRDYPEVVDAIYQRGLAAGAAAECQRIRDVEAQALPGHEQLIASLKFDGKTTGPEAAAKVVAAEKSTREKRLTDLQTEAPKPLPPLAGALDGASTLTDEERAERDWNASAEVRDEFAGRKEAYLAYKKAEREGKVREGKK